MEITKELVKFCSALKYDDLPSNVVDKAKYYALDFLGVIARGSQEESSKAMYRREVRKKNLQKQCTGS
jgi:2-methylcitrate dehydratase PrpD